MAYLEHANITVKDPKATAAILQTLFDWHIRWEGQALENGYTVHVGTDTGYLALYAPGNGIDGAAQRYTKSGALNHIGVVVDNIENAEENVKKAGFEPHNHADYEPGKRFYFDGPDGVEYEVVSYE